MMTVPFGLGPGELALLALGLMAASYARGYTGFGFSALVVASGSLVTDPVNVVPLAIFMEVVASLLQAVSVWRDVDWRRVGMLVAGAVIGNPIGVMLLAYASADMLRLGISGFVLIACAILLTGWQLQRRIGAAGTGVLGLFAGVANGATALGGLPVALFYAVGRESPAVARATLIAYFFITDAYAGAIMAQQGILNSQTLLAAAWAFPILLLGLWLGGRTFAVASPDAFRRFTLLLLVVLALLGIAKATGVI
jgi:hypothetical protein